MNEAQLRQLVRDTVARRVGADANHDEAERRPSHAQRRFREANGDPSHGLYLALINTSDSCMIEPHVPCNHCGYCKSHGY